MRIKWSTELESGVRSIDLQHEELIEMLNELSEGYAKACSGEVLDDVMQRLEGYIVFHFSTEEALMAGLPRTEKHIERHKQEHLNFVDKFNEMRHQSKHDGLAAMGNLIDFLHAWLYEHILKTDRQLGALLISQSAQLRD